MPKPSKLRISFLNPGSLGSRHDELLAAIDKHSVDILAINETWLRQGEGGRAPRAPGYQLRHIPRSSETRSRGGGVGFYIRRGLTARTHAHPITPLVEQMWLWLNLGGKTISLGTAYRPPWLSVAIFLDGLTETISSLPSSDHVVLVGDFNINFLNIHHHHYSMLQEFLTIHNFKQFTTEPTHFTSESETLLDLVCCNSNLDRVWVDYIPDLSSHSFIHFDLNIPKVKLPSRKITFRPVKTIDQKVLLEALNIIDWDSLALIADVDSLVGEFTNSLLWVFDILAPIKTVTIKPHQHPWITYNIKLMMQARNEAGKRARLSKSSSSIEYYKDLRRQVTQAIAREKNAYFQTYIISNTRNPRLMI